MLQTNNISSNPGNRRTKLTSHILDALFTIKLASLRYQLLRFNKSLNKLNVKILYFLITIQHNTLYKFLMRNGISLHKPVASLDNRFLQCFDVDVYNPTLDQYH